MESVEQIYARKKGLIAITGKIILFAAMQFGIASVEMSSKFSVKNFSKDQITLQHAADSLCDYMFVGLLWGLGTSCMFFGSYGIKGVVINVIANFCIMFWIYYSYVKAFQYASRIGNLQYPKMFRKRDE